MPLKLEKVESPSAQDIIDLEKLYRDYPTEFRFDDLQALLKNNAGTSLYAGRFNDRLIAAITVTEQEPITLNHLCTRAITRNRGVAKELLRQLLHIKTHGDLHFNNCINAEGIAPLFIQAGFTASGNHFTLKR
jgi:hypothetical protein